MNFSKKIKMCKPNVILKQEICLKSNVYDQRQYKTVIQKIDCKCSQDEFSYQCDRKYCGKNSVSCKLRQKFNFETQTQTQKM